MLLAAAGSVLSGVMGFAQSRYQAAIASRNAQIAKDNASRAVYKSQIDAQMQDTQTTAMIGQQESLQAASGLSLNSESSRRLRRSAAILGRLDTLNVRQAGEVEKYNYLTQAANFEAESRMAQFGGVGSLLGGFLGAAQSFSGTSLIGGARSTGSQYNPLMRPTA